MMELRDGQQTGVEVKWLASVVPCWIRSFWVDGMKFKEPRRRSWSSERRKTMLGCCVALARLRHRRRGEKGRVYILLLAPPC